MYPKDILELFYDDEEDKRKVVIYTASKLYDKLLNIYMQLKVIILQKIRRKK